MLKKRIIPCLDIKEGRTVKGVNFVDIRDAGDPVELAKKYVEQRADELEKKRQAAVAERKSIEAVERCNEVFTPEPPKFQATLFVLGIPTLGVAAAVLMLMAVVRVFRWVGRGFIQS